MAYRVFVCPVAEYGSVLRMGASATQLSKFDRMQHLAEQLCSTQLYLLRSAVMLQLLVYYASYWMEHVVNIYRGFVHYFSLQFHCRGDLNV